nr:3-keto-5-aminohexanoate cleavage protein [Desulfobacterales bacterium]
MEKLVITVALTGNVPTKQMNPNLPVTAEEIAADVRRCSDAGACLFHVHARDADQKPTLDIEAYKSNARAIKASAPDVILQLSTGARAGKDWEARAKPIRLLPEMGSFTTGSNNLPG